MIRQPMPARALGTGRRLWHRHLGLAPKIWPWGWHMCVYASFCRRDILLRALTVLPAAPQCMQLLIDPYSSDRWSMGDLQEHNAPRPHLL